MNGALRVTESKECGGPWENLLLHHGTHEWATQRREHDDCIEACCNRRAELLPRGFVEAQATIRSVICEHLIGPHGVSTQVSGESGKTS